MARKKASQSEEEFVVNYEGNMISESKDGTVVITSSQEISKDDAEKLYEVFLSTKKDKQYSVTTSSSASAQEITLERIDTLTTNIHSNKENLLNTNNIILQTIDKDGLMGYAYSCISSNTPTTYKITYDRNADEDLNQQAKEIVDKFNRDICIERFIRNCVSIVYSEGNLPMIMRNNGERSIIDFYPLSICYPSDYKVNGDRQLEFDISELKRSLQKVYRKDRKNKALYFANIEREIKANYPPVIYKAYKAQDNYAVLDTRYSDCLQINTFNRKYGTSPFMRALRPLVVINNIENADVAASRARSKNIIYQKLRGELLKDGKRNLAIQEQANAHASLMSALQTNLCAYTSPACVESLEFVTSKANNTESSKQLSQYVSKYVQALGISFADTEVGNTMSAKISITQIIRNINEILEDVARILNKFYRTLCEDAGIELDFYPTIKIDSAETMEMDMRIQLSKYIYSTLNGSRTTAYDLIGISAENEKELRKIEDEKGYDEVFQPYPTSYTYSDKGSSAGRPLSNEDEGEQINDQLRNE